MRLLIVDDEPHARRRLASLIEEIDQEMSSHDRGSDTVRLEIVGEATDGMTALELVRSVAPDVVLLDVAMPEVDGLDVARHIPRDRADFRPLIIFQTAYHEYALQAFEEQALDFVVKPVRKDRLAQALERARVRLATLKQAGLLTSDGLERLGSALGHQRIRPARLLVRHGAGHRLLPVRSVTRFGAADGLVHAHTASAEAPVTDYTLGELAARLGAGFVRTSRADLVNVSHVEKIVSNGDGSATLTLSTGEAVRVSRRRAADVRRMLEE
jgi:DNA-binding LytR/AlgR family response regulator